MNKILMGALAGLVATLPMTVAMVEMKKLLPKKERYPLPPREAAMEIAQKAGVKKHLDERQRKVVSLAAHFGYGAAMGAVYAPLAHRLPLPPALRGASYGLFIWSVSYLGCLPALGILTPATEHPARRNALMLTAAVIWGVGLSELAERFK